ncbi:MAG: glycosyltransferase family 4 protein [Phycisphaerales bacterium]|nr:glycosyltransferase family 4 protein [Phycisphaerales bacterium]
MSYYLGIFSTHPIQYQTPLWRKLAARDDVRVHVYYASDASVRGEFNQEFGVEIKWDIPLLEGYPYTFLENKARKPGPAHKGFWSFNCPEVFSIQRRERFDAVLIHGYERYLSWQVIRSAGRTATPILIRGDNREGTGVRRSAAFEFCRSFVLERLYKRIAIGLSIGSYMRRHYINHGMEESRIVDCLHCVEDERFEAESQALLPSRSKRRSEMGIREDDLVLIFSGKLIPRKNPMLLARALKHVQARERVWIFIAGDGPLYEELERALRDVIGERAVMLGFLNQSQLGNYYSLADLHVLPSVYESWGLVVNEAMYFGLPAVVTDRVGCGEDLAIPYQTGFIIPNNDAEALGRHIQELVGNPALLKKMKEQAAHHIRQYSMDGAVEGIVEGCRRAKAMCN